jgi:hypothetical protein
MKGLQFTGICLTNKALEAFLDFIKSKVSQIHCACSLPANQVHNGKQATHNHKYKGE